jgi:DNA invertase Pin-like site-specific DNA recombinase
MLRYQHKSFYIPSEIQKAGSRYRGRVADVQKHELIRTIRLTHGKSLQETARLAGVPKMTVIRVCASVVGYL